MHAIPLPLHPNPYSIPNANSPSPSPYVQVHLKPKVRRIECEAYLPKHTNYDPDANNLKIDAIALQSSRAEMPAEEIVSLFIDNKIILISIEETLQLRPSLTHIDSAREKESAAGGGARRGVSSFVDDRALDEGGGGGSDILPMQVQVKKRETEQQVEARLRSYAHHAQQEMEDTWMHLTHHPSLTLDSQQLAKSTRKAVEELGTVNLAMPPLDYIHSISLHAPPPDQVVAAAAAAGIDEFDLFRRQARRKEEAFPEEYAAALPSLLKSLLDGAPVVTLDLIRGFLRGKHIERTNPEVHSLVKSASDSMLHGAVTYSGDIVHLRKHYIMRRLEGEEEDVNSVREVVVMLLEERELFKKSEVLELATRKGIEVDDILYSKVTKHVCRSRGGHWGLKVPQTVEEEGDDGVEEEGGGQDGC
jgi:DNA-directed RNA polymerase III subunit RPC5